LPEKTVIEIDGEIHDFTKEYDEARTRYLEEMGFSVLRFKNAEVYQSPEKVTKTIKEYIDQKQKNGVKIPSFEMIGNEVKSPSFGRVGNGIKSPSFGGVGEVDRIEISYSYQKIITDILIARTLEAQKKYNTESICIVGGVSANSALRGSIESFSKKS